jgi:hypothetical protein
MPPDQLEIAYQLVVETNGANVFYGPPSHAEKVLPRAGRS